MCSLTSSFQIHNIHTMEIGDFAWYQIRLKIPSEIKAPLKNELQYVVLNDFFALFFKALQEFQEVCSLPSNESEPSLTSKEGVLLILPYWPRLYTRLANDTDRRVREATQKAHLVGKETKQLNKCKVVRRSENTLLLVAGS